MSDSKQPNGAHGTDGADAKPKSTDPTDSAAHSADELFDFPCDFPIKVMGKTDPGFQDAIVDVLKGFDKDFDASRVETRPSSGGNYTGLTCTVRVQNRAHLDDIYRVLTGHPMVKIVL